MRSIKHPLDFLAGGGRVGVLMRDYDWSGSPLGPPELWPQSLRSVVGLLLQSQFPMFVGLRSIGVVAQSVTSKPSGTLKSSSGICVGGGGVGAWPVCALGGAGG